MGGRGRMSSNGFFMRGRGIHDEKNRFYTLLILLCKMIPRSENEITLSLFLSLGFPIFLFRFITNH
jgi:hypothetical protein